VKGTGVVNARFVRFGQRSASEKDQVGAQFKMWFRENVRAAAEAVILHG
jgi:hypothetical protein